MFRKLLTVGTLVVTLFGGIGTALAWGTEYNCGGAYTTVYDQLPGKYLSMWVVHSERVFSNSFVKFDRKWNFTGIILECQLTADLPKGGRTYYAAEYNGKWVK
ncbi:hypothetical protein [Xenorhabdus griffiniae]|uniref:hypothetical protein n=1 Tax=Xenorhabdus griffiniae TaxID=351672 RepID=UPI00235A14FB|nr:hypothetical protein [Xenorhabdus griffiniae]MDC9606966.1 hypothetical protein [Xenorhabdus griffiniae]